MQLPALFTRWSELRSRGREGQRSVARPHFNQWKSFGLSEIEHRNNKICIILQLNFAVDDFDDNIRAQANIDRGEGPC